MKQLGLFDTPDDHRWVPTSTYLAMLEDWPVDQISYRQTPPGQPTVPELVSPGDYVVTSYGTGGRVIEVSGPHTDDGHGNNYPPHYTIVYEDPDKPSGRYRRGWLGELVAVNGRLLHLFEANPDEVWVVTRQAFRRIEELQRLIKEMEFSAEIAAAKKTGKKFPRLVSLSGPDPKAPREVHRQYRLDLRAELQARRGQIERLSRKIHRLRVGRYRGGRGK